MGLIKSNSNESYQKWSAKCHFTILNSVLVFINSFFVLMVCVKIRCYFNNLIFLLKNIIKLVKYEIIAIVRNSSHQSLFYNLSILYKVIKYTTLKP